MVAHHFRVVYIHLTNLMLLDSVSIVVDPMGLTPLDLMVDLACQPHILVGKIILLVIHHVHWHVGKWLDGD